MVRLGYLLEHILPLMTSLSKEDSLSVCLMIELEMMIQMMRYDDMICDNDRMMMMMMMTIRVVDLASSNLGNKSRLVHHRTQFIHRKACEVKLK